MLVKVHALTFSMTNNVTISLQKEQKFWQLKLTKLPENFCIKVPKAGNFKNNLQTSYNHFHSECALSQRRSSYFWPAFGS
jgi:hypothetical protein